MERIDKINDVIMQLSFSEVMPKQDMSLKDDLGFDSLNLVGLIVMLEDELGITLNIADLDPERLATVGDLYTVCGVK